MDIHDHFEGTFHCIECRGQCRLTGESLRMTTFVRNVCEFLAYTDYWIPPQIEEQLRSMVRDYAGFKKHCLEHNPKRVY